LGHNLLYTSSAATSSKLLHQIRQLEQVLIPKQASAAGYRYKRIFRHNRGPTRRNGAQFPLVIVKVDPVLGPVVAMRDQFELAALQRMMRMDYFEVRIGKITMRCS
jgi:hypothetical protein